MKLETLFFLVLLFSNIQYIVSQNDVEYLDDNEEHSFCCTSYEAAEKKITIAKGYKLLVTVKNINIKGSCGDYLIIKSGHIMESEGTGLVFTDIIKSPRTFLVHSNKILMKLRVDATCTAVPVNDEEGGRIIDKCGPCVEGEDHVFNLVYKREGKEILTTTEGTTEYPWPTPNPTDKIYANVFINGKSPEEYKDDALIELLRTQIAAMATEYCESSLIQLEEDITFENVQIAEIKPCPHEWPESSTCVEMQFKLPIQWIGADDEYKLTAEELEIMWERLASKYLKQMNVGPYEIPNIDEAITWWIVCIVVVLVLVLLLLLFVVLLKLGILKCKGSKSDDDDDDDDIRFSNMDNKQPTPPFLADPDIDLVDYDSLDDVFFGHVNIGFDESEG